MFKTREEDIEGLSDWLWPEGDSGLWDGPRTDWIDSHHPKILEHCEGFDLVVQAGGGCGMYPRLLSQFFKQVYTFEPDHINFHCLVHNVLNHPNVNKMQAALGDQHMMVGLNCSNLENRGTYTISMTGDCNIPQLCIDDLVLPSCNLLMLDVEGYENCIVAGALATIDCFKPLIFAENGNSIKDTMEKMGYTSVGQSVADTIYKYGKV